MPMPPVLHVVLTLLTHKTHSDIPLVALVSCQIGQNIPHSFYCCLIDFPPPRTALSTARTFIRLMQCDFQPGAEKAGFPVSLSRTKVTLQTVFFWKQPQFHLTVTLPSGSCPWICCCSVTHHALAAGNTAPPGTQQHWANGKAKRGHWLTTTVLRAC